MDKYTYIYMNNWQYEKLYTLDILRKDIKTFLSVISFVVEFPGSFRHGHTLAKSLLTIRTRMTATIRNDPTPMARYVNMCISFIGVCRSFLNVSARDLVTMALCKQNEPHQKTYLRTCASSKDSNWPAYLISLIRIFTWHMMQSFFMRTMKMPIRLRV